MLDAETGQPHPVWAEIDLNAGLLLPGNGTEAVGTPKRAAVLVRPARNFDEGRRYVVVMKNLPAAQGGQLSAQRAFAQCRDGVVSALPGLGARCQSLQQKVFPVLQNAGIDVAGHDDRNVLLAVLTRHVGVRTEANLHAVQHGAENNTGWGGRTQHGPPETQHEHAQPLGLGCF